MKVFQIVMSSIAIAILTACGSSPEAVAITQCQEAIRLAAKNPSSTEVPYTRAQKEGDSSYRMIWKHGDGLRMQNGFGAMIDTTAICVVREGKIYALDVGDKQII
ncbi:hypothetical protein [Pseudoxanthomonas mexicana]|uniref:hypothetical protein n=1 Tax=Pseudoxanthomonas mexicana TaxID=128785 RepID=UPI00398B1EA0